MTFNVNTATISNVTPASGVPGTPVTIAGSGFGAAQGSGLVWLGTANGVVQSWSDTQVVATVAPGAASGSARVLQNGVMSNAVPFTVNSLHITISPASGLPGTSVMFTGTGFGSSQGTGTVWLGSTNGQVITWSDTQVVAAIAPSAVTGIARIQQNGVWSNSLTFTVPVSGGNTVTLAPNLLNMAVGDTHTIQALSPAGQPVTGLTWTSSDPSVVGVSSDDPPVLSALAAGHVTITAGAAAADVTVFAGALPLGTVLWSNPGTGPGAINSIVPAVPSPGGVADVFAFARQDGYPMDIVTVQAITSDGATAWTVDVSDANSVVPDFQGGLVVVKESSIVKLDGMTGQPYSAYTVDATSELSWGAFNLGVHPDGTVFTVLRNYSNSSHTTALPDSVIGIDPTKGTKKFSVPLPCGQRLTTLLVGAIVAGDGYAYVPYDCLELPDGEPPIDHLMLLRVNSSGVSDNLKLIDNFGYYDDGIPFNFGGMIANADQGVLATWTTVQESIGGVYNPQWTAHMATTTDTSVSAMALPLPPNQYWNFRPVLQAQDGSFVGAADVGDTYAPTRTPTMIAFDATGNVRWTVANETPRIATDDDGVIAKSGITYDQNGNATGQGANSSGGQSPGWLGNALGTAYSANSGAVSAVTAPTMNYATTFAALQGGNASGQGTAIQQVMTKLPQDGTKQLPNLGGFPVCFSIPIPPLTSTCGNINAIELLTSASPDSVFQNFIQTFAPVTASANPPNPNMTFTAPGNAPINVTGPGQILTIAMKGWSSLFQKPFSVMTERFDPAARTISVVTLAGHPLAGWRYWRVYSIGTNDVVIETGAYDQPGPGLKNYAGYYVARRLLNTGWEAYLKYIKLKLQAPQGSNLQNTLGGTKLRYYSWPDGPLLNGYWDYFGDFTQYILNNVCQSTVCN